MKVIVLFYFAFVGVSFVVGIDNINTCAAITCVPDDEFENEETVTNEWDSLMNLLWTTTFQSPYSLRCRNNTNQLVEITYEDDFIWDLRFELYNERQNEGEKTLNDCYCEFQGEECKSEAFRECLKSVRKTMHSNFNAMGRRIGQKLVELAQQC